MTAMMRQTQKKRVEGEEQCSSHIKERRTIYACSIDKIRVVHVNKTMGMYHFMLDNRPEG